MTEESIVNVYFDQVTESLKNNGEVKKRSEEFAKLKSDLERVKYVLSLKAVEDVVKVPCADKKYSKSLELAQKYRVDGNKKFQTKNYKGALDLYNKCVLLTPSSNHESDVNTDLSLAYANRSAALYHLNKFTASLDDVQLALDNKYPEKLQYKLYDRQAKCYLELKDLDSAMTAYENARNTLNKCELDAKKQTHWQKELTAGLSSCKSELNRALDGLHVTEKSSQKPTSSPTVHGNHSTFTSLSESCDVNYSSDCGRYVVADESLRPGDIVLVEKPFASVLLPEHHATHCDCCFTRLVTVVACHNCSYVRFCGVNCRNTALRTYHKYECSVLQAVEKCGKFEQLALRSITCKSARFFQQFREKVKSDDTKDCRLQGCDSKGQYNSDDYNTIYTLVTHSQQRSSHDLFYRALTAAYLLRCLQHTSFFTESNGPDDLDSYVGSLILSHLQSFPINAHEISELVLDKTDMAMSTCQEIGAGIYSTLSLFNHSCDPAVTRHFYGDRCVVRALRPVSRGEQLSDNYGAVFAVQNKQERQDKLQQYYFTCGCTACKGDWPLYNAIRCDDPLWVCGKCRRSLVNGNSNSVTCESCHTDNNLIAKRAALDAVQEKYISGLSYLLECQIDCAMKELTEALVSLYQHVQVPWRDVNNAQEALKQCFNTLGNCHVVQEKH